MINDLKDLKALFKLCRAQGITDFKMSGLEIKFGDLPNQIQSNIQEEEIQEPSEENMIFWSTPQGQQEIDKKVGLKS